MAELVPGIRYQRGMASFPPTQDIPQDRRLEQRVAAGSGLRSSGTSVAGDGMAPLDPIVGVSNSTPDTVLPDASTPADADAVLPDASAGGEADEEQDVVPNAFDPHAHAVPTNMSPKTLADAIEMRVGYGTIPPSLRLGVSWKKEFITAN